MINPIPSVILTPSMKLETIRYTSLELGMLFKEDNQAYKFVSLNTGRTISDNYTIDSAYEITMSNYIVNLSRK